MTVIYWERLFFIAMTACLRMSERRWGKLVYTLFFKEWTHDELRLVSDGFVDLEPVFYKLWRKQVS